MAYVTVDVDVYIDEFSDKELISELRSRGYYVSEVYEDMSSIEQVAWLLNMNKVEDALILLERDNPSLKGITKKVLGSIQQFQS